jgi:hypothetical protein
MNENNVKVQNSNKAQNPNEEKAFPFSHLSLTYHFNFVDLVNELEFK